MRKSSALAVALSVASTAAARDLQVYAHRGARSFAPENTIPAYKTGLRIGADWMDMDIVLTKDGEVLVGHDPVLNPAIVRGPDGKFVPPGLAVKDMTLAQLRRLDVGRLDASSKYASYFPDQLPVDGTRMPTLREVIRFVEKTARGKVGFQIELKTDPTTPAQSAEPAPFAAALYRILKDEKIVDRAEIQAFDWRCLYALQELDPKVKTAYLTSRDNEKGGVEDLFSADPKIAGLWTGGKLAKDYGSIPKMVKALGGFAWEPEDAELTKEALDEAHGLGLKVVVWTWPEKSGGVFDAAMAAKLIDWGVDGIITDDPGRLDSMLAARGRRVPARFRVE
jgi:glycerophosphoryl diester phosphodiesterase